MTLDLTLWRCRYNDQERPHPALTSARLANGLSTPELENLDRSHVDSLLSAEFPGYDADPPGEICFECDFEGRAVFIGLPWGINDEVIERLFRLAEAEGLYVHNEGDAIPADVEEQIESELEEQDSMFDIVEDRATIRQRARTGDAEAEDQLGTMYSDGDGLPQDDGQAFHWYSRAAKGGDPTGMFNLAWCYRNGRGTGRDIAAAIRWLERAMKSDKQCAPLALGEIYAAGDGVPVDPDRARSLLQTALEHGNYDARKLLRALDEE